MRHRRKFFKVVALMATVFGIAAFASGCRHSSPEARVDHISDRIASKLDFNDDQKRLLKDITADIKADMAANKAKRDSFQNEMQAMIRSNELDQIRLKQLLNERHEQMSAKADSYIAKVATLHKTLSAAQKEELIEFLEKFHKRWE